MHDDPAPTESEKEQTPERIPEEEAKAGQGHADPRAPEDPAEA